MQGLQSNADHVAAEARLAPLRLALIAPDMAPNVGALLRLGACLGVGVDVVEPCGFPFSPRAWRRSAMDYAALAELVHHTGWSAFRAARTGRRLIALSARAEASLWAYPFVPGDVLMLGSETAGLPAEALAAAEARLAIPLRPGARSLNVAQAGAIAASEALRRIGALPRPGPPHRG